MTGTLNNGKQEIVWKIINVLEWTTDYFKKHNLDEARLKAEILLADVLKFNRLELYQYFDRPLSKDELNIFKGYVKRAVNHEPVQMITGKVPFYNVDVFVSEGAIVPRPETEGMVAMIIEENKDREGLKILDIGTGSGCIALSLGKYFTNSHVIAIDRAEEALALAEKNKLENSVENVVFIEHDVLKNEIEDKFDVIVSNPPYIPKSDYDELEPELKNWEPKEALTDGGDGLSFYRRYAEVFPKMLKEGGVFYLEIGDGQQEEIKSIFSEEKFEIEIYEDLEKKKRYVAGKMI